MPKRKRDENEANDRIGQIEDRAVRIKASRLNAKLEQSNKTLKDAVQLARGFERQKLSRRQKQAESKPHDLLRLREEVIVVKELDPTKVAKDYLFKQLVKTKRIKESPAFVALFGNEPEFERPKSTAEGNVLARLFKSNPVREVLPEILRSIKDILLLNDPLVNGKSGISMGGKQDPKDVVFDGFSDDNGVVEDAKTHVKLLEGVSLDDISDSDEELAAYDKLLDGSETDDNISHSEDDLDARVPMPATKRPGKTNEPKPEEAPEKINKTAFLPSLSMGGYYSGSESDGEDRFDLDEGSTGPQQRKNRRGQRARREIAAKKYGQNAKHLANARDQGNKGRDSGWDPRKGAVESRTRGRPSRGSKGVTGANRNVVNLEKANARNAGKKADGPLHPSWEAARKKKMETGTASFAGKKITFD